MGCVGQPHSTWYRNNAAEQDVLRSRYPQRSPEHPSTSGEELWCRNAFFSDYIVIGMRSVQPIVCLCFTSPPIERAIAFTACSRLFRTNSAMLVINEGWANTLGAKGRRKGTSACCPIFPPKDGDEEKAPTPQGLQGVCNDALPLALNIFQWPVSSSGF